MATNTLEVYNIWEHTTYEEFKEILKSKGLEVPPKLERKIKMFFNVQESVYIHPKELEEMINVIIFGLNKKTQIPKEKLLKFLKENKTKFSEKEYQTLKTAFEAKSGYSKLEEYDAGGYYMEHFYKLYFNLTSYRNYGFTKEKYLSVRDKCIEKMTPKAIELLDAFYLTGEKNLPQKELAKKFNMSLQELKEFLRTSKKQALNIYLGKSYTITLDMNIYKKWLSEETEFFPSPNDEIIKKFIIDEIPYKTLAKEYGLTNSQVSNLVTNAIWKIDLHRFNLTGSFDSKLSSIGKENLEELLKDPHLPVSDKERDIMISIFGLYDTPKKSLEELAQKYQDGTRSIYRRLERALIMIHRYQNGEIPKKLVFDIDVAPYLRYLPRSDQELLTFYYADGLPVSTLMKIYSLNDHQVRDLLYKAIVYIKDIQDRKIEGLDFEYFYRHIDDKDIPYYGDIEFAKELFRLYFEEHKSYDELVDLYPELKNNTKARNKLTSIIFAVLKHREGVRKKASFTYEEIRDYYLAHESEMYPTHKLVYYKYFERREDCNYDRRPIPNRICLDLLKSNPNYFNIENKTKNEIKSLITKYRDKLPLKVVINLCRIFDIDTRELMSGRDIRQVLSFLEKVALTEEKEKPYIIKPIN